MHTRARECIEVGARPVLKTTAFVVGPEDGAGDALMDMARGLGFGTLLRFSGIAGVEVQAQVSPLMFFLFSAEEPGEAAAAARSIRACQGRRIRYSPMIYFAESPSVDTIRQCIGMGFDDVITLPFIQHRVYERLSRQLGHVQVYYETPSYFGPDRRNRFGEERRDGSDGASAYRRIEISRSIEGGISVLRDQVIEPAPADPAYYI